eukprot:TRINITY_DN47146_c0_g1_i1.p1 TRINITY_DN47146_c0_g1~~TRINITY_DN47146_c0_g1_i1.p1  ORF type:complete len:330 (-),score=46.13 TRINITY_DN47146_c0_g1_i1:73-1062(-)
MRAETSTMCSSIGVVNMTESAMSFANGRMFHEALLHFGDRLERLGDEVRNLETRVNELGELAQRDLDCLSHVPSSTQLHGGRAARNKPTCGYGSSSLARRVTALESGQKTVAAGARRALRRAMTVQRSIQEEGMRQSLRQQRQNAELSLGKLQSICSQQEVTDANDPLAWCSNLEAQEQNLADLDEQVALLTSQLHIGESATAEVSVCSATGTAGASAQKFVPASSAFMWHQEPGMDLRHETSAVSLRHDSCTTRDYACEVVSVGRDDVGMGNSPGMPFRRSQSLVELMEEAVEEAEMEELHKAAREEAERLRKELRRVETKSRCRHEA